MGDFKNRGKDLGTGFKNRGPKLTGGSYTNRGPFIGASKEFKNRGNATFGDVFKNRGPVAMTDGALFLFQNSEVGVWYDPNDLSTMFQNSDGTTAVAVGDPVGYIADKSGNSNHATQATEASRPILRESGGLYYLEFDGTDDFLVTSNISWPGTYTAFAGISPDTVTGVQSIADIDLSTGTRSPQFLRLNGAVTESIAFVGSTAFTDTGPNVSIGSHFVLSANCNLSTLDTRNNGVSNGTTAIVGTLNSVSRALYIGRYFTSAIQFFNGNLYSLIVRGALSDATEIASAEAYVNSKTGAY